MHHGHGAGLGIIQADPGDDERVLIAFTALLGGLIGLDLVLGLFGWKFWAFVSGASSSSPAIRTHCSSVAASIRSFGDGSRAHDRPR